MIPESVFVVDDSRDDSFAAGPFVDSAGIRHSWELLDFPCDSTRDRCRGVEVVCSTPSRAPLQDHSSNNPFGHTIQSPHATDSDKILLAGASCLRTDTQEPRCIVPVLSDEGPAYTPLHSHHQQFE